MPSLPRLQIDQIAHPRTDLAVLALAGELDLDTEPLLAAGIAAAMTPGRHRLILECSGITFCDSRGLSYILGVRLDLNDRDGSLILAAPGAQFLRTMQIIGADQALTLTPGGITEAVLLLPPDPSAAAL
ncbi:STAS domain-containing protein [Streptomyces sp. So13.3]|uniref:STAS domain-containing protein n=1 Tax=Streptomyces TaxID=1883 RepID=UPI00164D3071|nr:MULTISPECIES: STAS domain-containing protein [Streptomyces]MCZ4103567.1 STAS domain-containing protein [Streptomyces sp. H39-C1]QNA77538.1 STAS domain-containing protein [Streptomyces sp. So13.3]